MNPNPHVASYQHFIEEALPAAIGVAFDLVEYRAQGVGSDTGEISITVNASGSSVSTTYQDIPMVRDDGTLMVNGRERVVVMAAEGTDLRGAAIRCVGEQLLEEIAGRTQPLPEGVALTEELLQAWLPLGKWIRDFLTHSPTSQVLDATNWLDRRTALRRIVLPEGDCAVHPSHRGCVCCLETPEGPNSGRVLHLAMGAEVRDGHITVVDDTPEGALGLSAGMVPLVNHNSPVRALMGVNMTRQWLPLPESEAALVRSGNEPEAAEFWCGRNLLTAFIHWKGLNYEDGIVVSESCAARLASPDALEPGDKLSNRHGTKGVIGAILPDDEMPHTEDGRAVDIIYDFIGLHTRCNFGQVLEAVLGNVAHTTGNPVIAPPLDGPSTETIREMLTAAGLPASGQMQLREGRDGEPLEHASTVGYVYWGKTVHTARPKLARWTADGTPSRGCRQGELEWYALRARDAHETMLETYCLRNVDAPGVESLAERLAVGPVEQLPPPSPAFVRLSEQLRRAGITMDLDAAGVAFSLTAPGPDNLSLATPIPHPWFGEISLTHLTVPDRCDDRFEMVTQANRRAERLVAEGDTEQAQQTLGGAVAAYLRGPSVGEMLRGGNQVSFSGRAVLAPGAELKLGQVGLPDEMAWGLFEPLVAREVGVEAATGRTPDARAALERAMAENVVLVHRAPSVEPTSITAFTPVLTDGPVIRMHPFCCRLFNADHDGDQVAVFLPITEAGQAKQKLTIDGHMTADPGPLMVHTAPDHAVLWGLAYWAGDEGHRPELLASWPSQLPEPPQSLTRDWFIDALGDLLSRSGPQTVMRVLDCLKDLGTLAVTRSGASIAPFVGEDIRLPAPPTSLHPWLWRGYCAAVDAALLNQGSAPACSAFPQVLAARSGARGGISGLRQVVGPRGVPADAMGERALPGGYRDGLDAEDCISAGFEGVESLQAMAWRIGEGTRLRNLLAPRGDGILARAMRSCRPERAFAEAARDRACDPLDDVDGRLFVGLRPK